MARLLRRSSPMAEPELTYEQAVERLEEKIRRLDSGEAGLRETLDLVREGRTLIDLCAAELDEVSQGLEEVQLDELIDRLEKQAPGGPADDA